MKYYGSENAITYLGRTFRTSGRSEMTDEEWKEIIEYLYRRPDFSDVQKEFKGLQNGGTKTSNIVRYYLIDLIYQTRNREDAWSIDEAKNCKEIWEYFKWKVDRSPKTFNSRYIGDNIETALRLCGVRCCRKVSNFPIKTMDELLEKYLPEGGVYYDFSCGWSHRMLSAIKNGVTYLGTDPNVELVSRLHRISKDYKDTTGVSNSVDIQPTGSETFHQQWKGTVDFCFSSPPYFNLEIYKSDNQSCDIDTDYNQWLLSWWTPTVQNINAYLNDSGVFAFNVKDLQPENVYNNLPGRELEKDMVVIAELNGFKLEDTVPLNNIRRPYEYKQAKISSVESVFVFRKS